MLYLRGRTVRASALRDLRRFRGRRGICEPRTGLLIVGIVNIVRHCVRIDRLFAVAIVAFRSFEVHRALGNEGDARVGYLRVLISQTRSPPGLGLRSNLLGRLRGRGGVRELRT